MSDEKERLKRIREAQIRSRDPGSSMIRNYDWAKHARLGSRYRQRNVLIEVFLSIPTRWRGVMMGFCFGAGVGLLFNAILLSAETRLLAFVPVLIAMIIGFVVGKTMEEPLDPY